MNKKTFSIITTALILPLTFTSCTSFNKKTSDKITHNSQFDIYGTWEYIASSSTPLEWQVAPPTITIKSDNTVSALFYESCYTGVISKTDTYQLNVSMLSLWAEGDKYEVSEENKEWTLIYDPTANLLKYGEDNFRKKTEYEFSHDVYFNEILIPMTVFYTPISDGDGISLNSLVFIYDGARQTLLIPDLEESLHFYNPDFYNFWYISVGDYNFDGYMDVSIYSSRSGVYNAIHEIFLYNPQTKNYNHHKELSDMMGAWADSGTKTINSHGKGGDAGMIYYFNEYKWEKEKLVLVSSENQDYDDTLKKYVRTTRTLQNGKWVQDTDIISIEE